MRIIIDLDGTICSLRKEGEDYADVFPLPGVKEKIESLKEAGHTIIIQTARHMKSTGSNIGLINKKVGQKTMSWLDNHQIPYDEIFFGKPYGNIYIDDNALEFTSWNNMDSTFSSNDSIINIVIPAGGFGKRFANAGYTIPKPLIPVLGKTMIERAVDGLIESFQKHFTMKLYFVIQQQHIDDYGFDAFLYSKYPGSVCIIDDKLCGQAPGVLFAKEYINNNSRLLIYNSDTYSTYSAEVIDMMKSNDIDGIIPCFESNDERYSYAKLDQYGYVESVVEKKVISSHATNGLYYFRQGKHFVAYCEEMIKNGDTQKGEYYVGPVYNYLVAQGKRIKISGIKNNQILGTPEELEMFLKSHKL